jgi:uncharacterized RDD family membrane protein YckC
MHDATTAHRAIPALPTAGLGPRTLARLIDFVLLAVVNAIVVGVLVVGTLLGRSGGLVMGAGASGALASALAAVLSASLNLAYFAGLESRLGQTLGKRALKLRVVGPTGGLPTLEEAVRRNVWVAFGIAGVVPVVGGLLGSLAQLAAVVLIAITLTDETRGPAWHDRFAGGTAVLGADTPDAR